MARHGSAGREAAQIAALEYAATEGPRTSGRSSSSPSGERAPSVTVCTSARIERICRRGRVAGAARLGRTFRAHGRAGRAHTRPVDIRPPRRHPGTQLGGQRRRAVRNRSAPPPTHSSPARTQFHFSARRLSDGELRYSTPELLAIESRVLDAAARLRASGRGVLAPDGGRRRDRAPRRSSPTSNGDGAPAHAGRRRRAGRRRARRNRQDDRPRRRTRGMGASRAFPSAAARSRARPHASSSRRPAFALPASRACSTARAPSEPAPCWSSTRRGCSAPATSRSCSTLVEAARGKLVLAGDASQLAIDPGRRRSAGSERAGSTRSCCRRTDGSGTPGNATRSRRSASATSERSTSMRRTRTPPRRPRRRGGPPDADRRLARLRRPRRHA